MIGANRPGALLLESLASDELRGRPGPARAGALEAADLASDPDEAAAHLIDAVLASLVAGEPGRAQATLDRADLADAAARSEDLRRQVDACQVWANQLRWNWYPGRIGAELPDGFTTEAVEVTERAGGSPESKLLEALVARGPVSLTSARSLLAGNRGATTRVDRFLHFFEERVLGYAQVANDHGDQRGVGWALCCRADLLAQAGRLGPAVELLTQLRTVYEDTGDPVGLARTMLLEGDWYATPGSSPEALGFDLPASALSEAPAPADDQRADALYRAAAGLLDGLDQPRAAGGVGLRLALLALRAGRIEQAETALGDATRAWSASGDTAGLHLLRIHQLLVDLAADRIAAVRGTAGAGWSLEPRGPLAEIADWARTDGSPSLCTGFGRLAQSMARRWRTTGDLERAAAAYALSVPLIGVSGAVSPSYVLDEQANLDHERGFSARALVRFEQAVTDLPPAPDPAGGNHANWLDHANLLMSIAQAQQSRVSSAPTARGVAGLERTRQRMAELVSRSQRAPDPALTRTMGAQSEALKQVADEIRSMPVGQDVSNDGTTSAMVNQTTTALANQVIFLDVMLAVARGRLAYATGWTVESDRWFAAALRTAESGGTSVRWLGVLVLTMQGKDAEARALFHSVASDGYLPPERLWTLALRVRALAESAALLEPDLPAPSAESWIELSDRAELALELGDAEEADELISVAIAQLEQQIGVLTRDPDRLAKVDDIKVPALYLMAARTALARADACTADDEADGWRRQALEHIDRSRALAIVGLVDGSVLGGDQELGRRWQETATVWDSQFNRLLASYQDPRLPGGDRAQISSRLTSAEDSLLTIEAEMERLDGGVLVEPHLPPRLDATRLQRSLGPDVLVVEFSVVGRSVATFGMTAEGIACHHRRLDRPVVERLANQLWRRCANGDHGAEAEELAAILLEPIAELLDDHRRVVFVPAAPLAAVPFAVLPHRGVPLGETHVISSLPSLVFLDGHHIDRPIAVTAAGVSGSRSGGVTVVGDPAFDPSHHRGLHRLPGAQVEARQVASIHAGTDLLIDTAAKEGALRQLLPHRSIIHLAAHGRLDEIAPSASSIVLAGSDELTVADLIGLRIEADLVVLSACDSGRGTATLGGELIGLTRGLLAAGVRQAVVSLWPVDDVVACVTMADFHRRLDEGAAPAVALVEAQRWVRTLDGPAIEAEYTRLGGDLTSTVRRSRRSVDAVDTSTTTRRHLMANPAPLDVAPDRGDGSDIEADPDFIDEPVPTGDDPDPGSGRIAANWAPFVLVGA